MSPESGRTILSAIDHDTGELVEHALTDAERDHIVAKCDELAGLPLDPELDEDDGEEVADDD